MSKLIIGFVTLTTFMSSVVRADEGKPWWTEQKIVYMWGQWNHCRIDKSKDFWEGDLPPELFTDLAQAGCTLFAELRGCRLEHARSAHQAGLKYFATLYVNGLPRVGGGRGWVKQSGEEHWFKCPLDEASYDTWLVGPHLEAAQQQLIDGINIDWEHYGGYGEADGQCYCDDCFTKFPAFQKTSQLLPDKSDRFGWLKAHSLVEAYGIYFSNQRVAMFTRLRKKLQAANPNLLFSSYGTIFSDFTRAMNTPQTPFIFLDSRHYYNDDRQAWWESYGERLRKEGYLYIPGGWTNALFGAQVSQVSASQWIYETTINEDGCWLWFERELDDQILRAYANANRRIKAVVNKVGDYLFQGKRDRHFVTAVEWTGRPELERAVVHQTYHLGNSHLVHVSNVDTQWPLRVRLRFPHLTGNGPWRVSDTMDELFFSHDGKSSDWSRENLFAGVVVTLEPRTDLVMLVAPANESGDIDASQLIRSRAFDRIPDHAAAAKLASVSRSPTRAANPVSSKPVNLLLYTATESMGFGGPEGGLTLSNAIRAVDVRWQIGPRLRQLHGHLWSPRYSPDGTKIAFVHDAGGRGQIHVMNADGSRSINISNNAFCDRSPTWSPNGKAIAFMSDRTGDWDIHVMAADGSSPHPVAENPGLDRAPTWSPVDSTIAWESHGRDTSQIWVGDADGQNSRPLISSDKPLSVEYRAPGKDEVFNFVEVDSVFRDNTTFLKNPVWSPDGKSIAAVGLGNHGGDMAVVIDVDGSHMLQVIRWISGIGELAWSPDGTQLAGTLRTAPQETERSGVFVVKADGTEKYRWRVEVTPQGPRLGGARRHGLMTWYSHGSAQPHRVVKTFSSLAWSPDGKTLAFSSDIAPSGAFYVYTMPVEGGEPKRIELARSAWPQQIMWQPQSD